MHNLEGYDNNFMILAARALKSQKLYAKRRFDAIPQSRERFIAFR